MIKPHSAWLGTGIAAWMCMLLAAPVKAQPILLDASPAADALLNASPEIIELTFDRAVSVPDTTIEVRSADGTFSFTDDVIVDPANRFKVSLELLPLVEGVYQVHYAAQGIGSSTLAVGSYTFTVDPPDPELSLVSPVNGEAFAQGETIPLEMRIQSFEFGFFNNRIRIYVDNELQDEIQATRYEIDGLTPGVHEIRVVLAQNDDAEFSETANVVIIAIAQDDPETIGRIQAAAAPPAQGLNLTALQIAGVIALTAILLGIGIVLGRFSPRSS